MRAFCFILFVFFFFEQQTSMAPQFQRASVYLCKAEMSWGWKEVELGCFKCSCLPPPAALPRRAAPSLPPSCQQPADSAPVQVFPGSQESRYWPPCPANNWEHSCLPCPPPHSRGSRAAGTVQEEGRGGIRLVKDSWVGVTRGPGGGGSSGAGASRA